MLGVDSKRRKELEDDITLSFPPAPSMCATIRFDDFSDGDHAGVLGFQVH